MSVETSKLAILPRWSLATDLDFCSAITYQVSVVHFHRFLSEIMEETASTLNSIEENLFQRPINYFGGRSEAKWIRDEGLNISDLNNYRTIHLIC